MNDKEMKIAEAYNKIMESYKETPKADLEVDVLDIYNMEEIDRLGLSDVADEYFDKSMSIILDNGEEERITLIAILSNFVLTHIYKEVNNE